MAPKSIKKSKMTLDKLAQMTQREFLHLNGEIAEIRENMATKEDLKLFATKEDLKLFATKEDLRQFKGDIIDEVRKENVKVLQSNDRVVTKLDILLKEEVVRTEQYKRQERDISVLKQKVGI